MNTVIRKSTTTEERYFHIRPKGDVNGNGGTVYFRKDPHAHCLWWAAASHISKNDTFSRKIGRTMAKRRYAKGHVISFGVNTPTFGLAVEVLNTTRKN